MVNRGRLRRPRLPAVYYGWYIVGAAMVAQMVAVGLHGYTLGVFLKPMLRDFPWSREDVANVQTIGTVVMGSLGLFVGGLVDRRGARPLMIAGALVAGLCLIGVSRVQSLGQFYLLRGVGFTVGSVGIGNLVVNVTLAKWFVRHRGIAMSVAAMGISLGGVIVTPLVQLLINLYGWRQTWVILGVAVWVIILPLAFVMRRMPEDYGLLPDGDRADGPPRPPGRPNASAVSEVDWTRGEAVRTPALWLLILAYGTANVGLGALLFHMVPFLTDSGFSAGRAALMFSTQSWAALLSKPLWGLLMMRVHARYLSAVAFVVSALTITGLIAVAAEGSAAGVVVLLALYGLGIGGTVPLQETVWASYFGRRHLGAIRAVAMPFAILFSALGPKFAARLYDRTGSYTAAFLIFAGFWLAGTVLVLLARPPRRRAVQPLATTTTATAGKRGT
jgi:OFA family oxalate/formate antiporter-like MFS transporter